MKRPAGFYTHVYVVPDPFGAHNFRVLRAGVVSHMPELSGLKKKFGLFINPGYFKISTTINNPASKLQTTKK